MGDETDWSDTYERLTAPLRERVSVRDETDSERRTRPIRGRDYRIDQGVGPHTITREEYRRLFGV